MTHYYNEWDGTACETLTCAVEMDATTIAACEPFDYAFNGEVQFRVPSVTLPDRDGTWQIGLIVGPSGSGKSTLLRQKYGEQTVNEWSHNRSVASHLGSWQQAVSLLGAVGLNSVPTWCKPFHVLSTGEGFRANIARGLRDNAQFDEFTSVVDRTVAKSCSHAIQRHIRKHNITGVVFASCHRDIIEWLQPDWVVDLSDCTLRPRGQLHPRPTVGIELVRCTTKEWRMFAPHHYLTGMISTSAKCWLGLWDGTAIAFTSSLPMPGGTIKGAWREHRTVVMPDYQGLGIGVRISDAIGAFFVARGNRYYSKTAHPRMGEYRNRSPLWRATCKNGLARDGYKGASKKQKSYEGSLRVGKVCFSHEYMGVK